MLGPSIMFLGAPVALVGSIWATQSKAAAVEHSNRTAWVALALSIVETLFVMLVLWMMVRA